MNSHPSCFKFTFDVANVKIKVKIKIVKRTEVKTTAVFNVITIAGILPELRNGFKTKALGSYNWKIKNNRRVYPPNQSIPERTHTNKKILASLESFSINYLKGFPKDKKNI